MENVRHYRKHVINSMKLLVLLFVSLILLANVTLGQNIEAELSGTVTDEADAVIPGAEVTIENVATGLKRTAVTNNSGQFLFLGLKPDKYTVTTLKNGFAPVEFRDIQLKTGDRKSLKVQLKVGTVGAEVTVVPNASTANVDASVSTVVDRDIVENIPTNGRSLQTLIALAPGVVLVPSTDSNPGQFTVNGQRTNTNVFSVDGVNANIGVSTSILTDQFRSGTLPPSDITGGFGTLASIDAIEEFQVLTSSYSAESGRMPGAQVRITTRSGKNQLHGSLYEYFRNDVFDANEFFNNAASIEKPPLRYNNFGGTFSGPLPFFNFGEGGPFFSSGKDNLHFFFSYEGKRYVLPQGASTIFVPTEATRNAETDLFASAVMNAFPLPNGPAHPTFSDAAEFTTAFSNPTNSDSFSIRIDKNVNSKYTFFGRYNYAPSDILTRNFAGASGQRKQKTNMLTLGGTQVFSQKVVNNLTFNWSKQNGSNSNVFSSFNGEQEFPSELFFPGGAGPGQRWAVGLRRSGLPPLNLGGGSVFASNQQQINIVDGLSITLGSHRLKFGGDFRRVKSNFGSRQTIGTVVFGSGTFSTLLNTRGFTSVSGGDPNDITYKNYSFYGQDTWNASKRATITAGLRWEYNPPPNNSSSGNLTLKSPPDLTQLDQNGLELAKGVPLYESNFSSFAPRFGIAYRLRENPGWETILRGGIGLFYDLQQTGFGSTTFPGSSSRFLFGRQDYPLPVFPLEIESDVPSRSNRVPSITIPGENFKQPRTYQWNLTAEQSISNSQILTVGYVGAAGRNLIRSIPLRFSSREIPGSDLYFSEGFLGIVIADSSGKSNYHSLQASYLARFKEKLTASVSYTLATSKDDSSNSTRPSVTNGFRFLEDQYGYSDFDVRHNLAGALTYRLPTPDMGKFGNAILGGWSLNSLFATRTGLPFTVLLERFSPIDNESFLQRPNLTGEPIWLFDPSLANGKRLNPLAFDTTNIIDGVDGNLERNSLRGPGMWQIDMGLHKEFNFRERLRLELRVEAFNIFNHTNFSNPSSLSIRHRRGVATFNPDFGRFTRTLSRSYATDSGTAGQTALFSPGGPRSLQFAFKLKF